MQLIVQMNRRLTSVQEALGRIESRQLLAGEDDTLRESEFKVYSQWGEDGIIQFLLKHVAITNRVFIEFGVENFTESNTRFLLCNNNWSGLVMDGSEENVRYIRQDPIYWRHNLKAACAFITRENINELILAQGISGDIGILSIDIDGNDYWVWEAVDCVSPAIVIMEYNARFGPDAAVTVPYDPAFRRSVAHHSLIYYGASLRALEILAIKKGYALVGCNSAGNNAFFVKDSLLGGVLQKKTSEEAYVQNQFREARDSNGNLLFLDPIKEAAILQDLPLVTISR